MADINEELGEYTWEGDSYPICIRTDRRMAVKDSEKICQKHIFYYVSDLHLDDKLRMIYPNGYDQEIIDQYVNEAILKLMFRPVNCGSQDYLREFSYGATVILCGDVSGDYQVATTFLREFTKEIKQYGGTPIFVLGNHEYWNLDGLVFNKDGCSVKDIVTKYRRFCEENDVVFLQNDVLLLDGTDVSIVDGESVMNASDSDLEKVFGAHEYIIFGGTGFSGKNRKYNADTGLYKNTIRSYDEDRQYTEEFDRLYQRMYSVFGKYRNVLVVTHNPPRDWLSGPPCPNWVYFHGHTHQKEFVFSPEMKILADNQWGWTKTRNGLKCYVADVETDIFRHYHDGVYIITKEQYLNFIDHKGIFCDMKRDGQIVMLKREGFYLFLLKKNDSDFYLLEGGRIHRMPTQSIEQIYRDMIRVAAKILDKTESRRGYLKQVSDFVKSIGGSGRIHGSIVDIDLMNHLYVNMLDGQITPYYATDMVNKTVYPDIGMLLKAHKNELLPAYERSINKDGGKSLLVINPLLGTDPNGTRYTDTDIYSMSNFMKRLQYTADFNIIRQWVEPDPDDNPDDDMPIEIIDETGTVEGPLSPRTPYVITPYSNSAIGRITAYVKGEIYKNRCSDDEIKASIREFCIMTGLGEQINLNEYVDKVFPEILSRVQGTLRIQKLMESKLIDRDRYLNGE